MISQKPRKGARHIAQLAAQDNIVFDKNIEDKYLFVWKCLVVQLMQSIRNAKLWKLTSVIDCNTHVMFTGFYTLKVTEIDKGFIAVYYRDRNNFTLFEESIKTFDKPLYKC